MDSTGVSQELGVCLAAHHAAAKNAWPRVALPVDQFARHVTERMPKDKAGAPPAAVLGAMAVSDLYLACACANRVPGSHEALEAAYFSKLPALLRKQFHDAPRATLDDACQLVRQKLLLGTPESGPHLLTYMAEGGLLSWIKIIAIRQVIKLLPQQREEEQDLPPESPPEGNEERAQITRELYERLRQVMSDAAVTALNGEERSLLDQYYKREMSQKDLALHWGTSQAGISRRLALVRETLRSEAKSLMRARYGVNGEELDSLIADQSRLDVTLSRIFGSRLPGAESSAP
ncbi:MAG TPA: sigma-70 family RNA polymerase sigma factor [Myxococcaceae bacterium]|jgi:RNA polymerase sigma-70 factor (ECF subfamily)